MSSPVSIYVYVRQAIYYITIIVIVTDVRIDVWCYLIIMFVKLLFLLVLTLFSLHSRIFVYDKM